MYIYLYVHTHARTRTHIYIYIYIYIHIYTYIYIHTHVHVSYWRIIRAFVCVNMTLFRISKKSARSHITCEHALEYVDIKLNTSKTKFALKFPEIYMLCSSWCHVLIRWLSCV